VSVLSTEHDGLKGVQAPTAQAPAYGQLLTSLQGVIDSAKKKGSAFINPNTTPFAVVNANATALGLDACVH
jgi:hypothetical protein